MLMIPSRRSGAVLFSALSILLAAACAIAPQAQASPADSTLTIALTKGLTTVDRLYSTQREGLIVSLLTDDPLFEVDPVTLKYVPLAAESYRWVNPTTLDVTLRQGLTFHDGHPLRAADVVYTYRWMLNPKANANNGPIIQRWLESVEELGPYKVRFHLKFPYPLALRDMAISVQLRENNAYAADKNPTPGNAIVAGLGPYKVVSFTPGRRIVLERYKGYYKGSPKGEPSINKIVFDVIPDIGTQQAELLSGGIDLAYALPPDVAENLGHTPQLKREDGPDIRVEFIQMDAGGYTGKDNPFTKLDVRRAMNYAINKKAIVDNLVRGVAKPIHTACNPVQFGCVQDVRRYDYDPAKAKELLAAAGYPHGFSFDLWAYQDKDVADAIVGDLSNVGITARLKYVPLSVVARARRSRETPAIFAGWGSGATADAAALLDFFFTAKTDRNFTRDTEVSDAVVAAVHTIDPKQRLSLYRKVISRIADQAYWVPLYSYTENYVMKKNLVFDPPKDGLPRFYLARWK